MSPSKGAIGVPFGKFEKPNAKSVFDDRVFAHRVAERGIARADT